MHLEDAPWWGRISLIWLMLVPLVVVVYTLLLPIAPNDFWYNARAGAFIATTGTIPSTALFTTSVPPGTPYYYQSWLAQLFLFKTLENYSLSGIVLLRTLCLSGAFVLILCAAWRRVRRINQAASLPLEQTTLARITAAGVLIAFILSASNMDIRPQTFSVPLFALFVYCLFEWPFLKGGGRFLVTILLILGMVLWANTHGAFFTGIILLGVYAGGELLHALFSSRSAFARQWGQALPRATVGFTLLLFPLAALAALANPRGPQLFAYVFQLAELEANQKYIQEWQAPHWSDWYGAAFFLTFALLCATTIAMLRQRSPLRSSLPLMPLGLRLPELLLVAALAAMAWRDIRSIIWFGLTCAPILAVQVTLLLLCKKREPVSTPGITRPAQVINLVLALLLIAGVLPFLPQWRTALPLPPEYFQQLASTPVGAFPRGFAHDPPFLLERDTPVKAVEYLASHPPNGKIWNDFVFGSYLAWATLYEPRLAPWADPRVEMRPLKFWDEYGRIAQGPPDAAGYLQTHGFSHALLHVKEQPRLIARLKTAGWRVVLAPNLKKQETAILLSRPSKQQQAVAN